ncbi:MAG TPA: hypothetical protein VK689_17130, partial [Armatimonadota bacterium]|nr:hypothetical protein [Armatimonadota bacterium]
MHHRLVAPALLFLLCGFCVAATAAASRSELVSVTPGGASGNKESSAAGISADGRYVVFFSDATDLVPNDTNGMTDVFVRDMETNTTTLVSVNLGGTASAEGASVTFGSVISADGRYVVFESTAHDLVAETTEQFRNVFVRDLVAQTTVLVSVDANVIGVGAGPGFRPEFIPTSNNPVISENGRYVLFYTPARLLPSDTNSMLDVYARDLELNATTLVSINATGSAAGGIFGDRFVGGHRRQITPDGRYAVFISGANDLAPNDVDPGADLFVRDLLANTTELVSVGVGSLTSRTLYSEPAISDNGRYVVFVRRDGDSSDNDRIYVRDRVSGTTRRIPFEGNINVATAAPAISGDGRFVAFEGIATPTPTTFNQRNIWIYDALTGATELGSPGLEGQGAGRPCSLYDLSRDGRFVAFGSQALNLSTTPSGGWPSGPDVFIRDRATGKTGVASVNTAGRGGVSASGNVHLARDAARVAFTVYSGTLTPADSNVQPDAFAAEIEAPPAPVARDDAYAAQESTPLVVPAPGVLVNDSTRGGPLL